MSCAMILQVRLTLGARAEGIDRIEARPADGVLLHARVRARPREGAAHAALVVMLAKAFAVPQSAVALLSGHCAG